MKDYIKNAIKTENKDNSAVSLRLKENKDEVFQALNQAILAIQNLDHIVKKKTFYGKPPKFYGAPLFQGLNPEVLESETFIRLLHGFMGIATEAGEGLEALASMHSGDKLDLVNVAEELGDVFWYCALVADTTKSTFEKEQEKNIAKLKKRHGEKFNDEKVMERDLHAERKILEK